VGKILDEKSITFGYNAQTSVYGDMIKMGIIDPVKVVRHALQDAASVASLLLPMILLFVNDASHRFSGDMIIILHRLCIRR